MNSISIWIRFQFEFKLSFNSNLDSYSFEIGSNSFLSPNITAKSIDWKNCPKNELQIHNRFKIILSSVIYTTWTIKSLMSAQLIIAFWKFLDSPHFNALVWNMGLADWEYRLRAFIRYLDPSRKGRNMKRGDQKEEDKVMKTKHYVAPCCAKSQLSHTTLQALVVSKFFIKTLFESPKYWNS